jgi:lipoprotein-releasing system ATP-binding protein
MIELRNIHKSFGTLEVLKGIDLTVGEAELVSIVGSSGAGKTTLLQIMGTLDAPSRGDVFIDGEHVNNLSEKRLAHLRNTKIGFVFQFHQLLPEFSALENVMIPSLVSGTDRKEAGKRAEELLGMMGLSERMAHRPNELSGGEKQRVAVARALVNRPTVVLADEPSGSLDTHNKEELHRLFARLRDELHQTFVIVTHDETLSRQADRIIRLSDGRIV